MNAPNIRRRGIMLVLSSPSGAGKTTLSRLLLERDATLTMSVSCTTRPKRPGEILGVDYHFVDAIAFEGMIGQGDMLEHAEVFGNRYGTPRKPVEAALTSGRDVLFDIDWQGTQQLKQTSRDDVVSVFVLPPSFAELEKRLHSRAQDTPEVVAGRMAKASDEMSHWAEYDYIIINQDIEHSVASVRAILTAERLRRARQVGLRDFVVGLTQA
ncbi:MAG: guanylate kinase [Alphaproteobacteria bacterium]|nr:guanylate kinase [Alphaproteobacteria bacterium]